MIKKDLPDKASDAKTMTKQTFDHMVEELTKNGSTVDILSVKPEQIADSLCAYAIVSLRKLIYPAERLQPGPDS